MRKDIKRIFKEQTSKIKDKYFSSIESRDIVLGIIDDLEIFVNDYLLDISTELNNDLESSIKELKDYLKSSFETYLEE